VEKGKGNSNSRDESSGGEGQSTRNKIRESAIDMFMTSNVGTTAWVAPEMFTSSAKASYSLKVDVYSFGMVLWELWERKQPFSEFSSRFDIMDAVKNGERPKISHNCPAGYRSLIERCVKQKPGERPNFGTIVAELKAELTKLKEAAALMEKANTMMMGVGGVGVGGLEGSLRSASFVNNNPSAKLLGSLRGAVEENGNGQEVINSQDKRFFNRGRFYDSVLSTPVQIRGGRELKSVDEFSTDSGDHKVSFSRSLN